MPMSAFITLPYFLEKVGMSPNLEPVKVGLRDVVVVFSLLVLLFFLSTQSARLQVRVATVGLTSVLVFRHLSPEPSP